MGAYYGREAVEHLARSILPDDPGASSHWREMHATFRYREGTLEGLRGFGTFTARSRWVRNLAHRALQQRWRRMGRAFPAFPSVEHAAREVARRQERIYDFDLLRQALTAAYLQARVPSAFAAGNVVLVIGDGFGALSSIVLMVHPGVRVVAVNLAKTLLVDLLFAGKALPDARHALATDSASMTEALRDERTRLIAVRAEDCALVGLAPAALAVNIASMQEMEPATIARYFALMRSMPGPVTFYCCNREEKALPDGTVVRFAEYPWDPSDRILDDALCPWHQAYYSARPPFVHPFDGPMRHRLAILAAHRGAATEA